MNKWRLDIEADTNDADYITSTNYIDDETLALIRPVVEAIKNFQPYKTKSASGLDWSHRHNFPYGECAREDLGEKTVEELYGHLEGLEAFKGLLPYNEYGFHTIESIRLMPIPKDVEVLL